MDGNGRWARKRYMPRFFGHKQGVDALVRAVNTFADRGVQYLTVFAFSSENWKRPTEEVSGLMSLVLVAVSKYLGKMAGDGVRIRIVGDRSAVSDKLRKAWEHAEQITQHNSRITLAVAFNYGGRWDVVQACRDDAVGGLLALPLADTLKAADADGRSEATLPRRPNARRPPTAPAVSARRSAIRDAARFPRRRTSSATAPKATRTAAAPRTSAADTATSAARTATARTSTSAQVAGAASGSAATPPRISERTYA
jgi:hypothetical protein